MAIRGTFQHTTSQQNAVNMFFIRAKFATTRNQIVFQGKSSCNTEHYANANAIMSGVIQGQG